MTKKHYIEIARNIKNSLPACNSYKTEQETKTLRQLVISLCSAFALDNPRFDSRGFTEACGFTAE